MTTDELEEEIVRLRVQNYVLRDALVWVLARDAVRTAEPEATIRLLAKFLDIRTSTPPTETTEDLRISDLVHEEIDWIIGAVTQAVRLARS
jgi:hypothetical protein